MSNASPIDPTVVLERERLDLKKIRADFPILDQQIRDNPLIYFDNAATSQTPLPVIEAIRGYYLRDNSNVHRGVHQLSQRATDLYEGARAKVREFLNAADKYEIVFVRGTTEGMNLIASTFGAQRVKEGDEVLISAMEHHSGIVPWQMLCERVGARLKVVPMNDDGELIIDEYEKLLTEKTRIVSLVHVSNALGTINPIQYMTRLAHERGIPVVVDGAQAAPHMPIDVRTLGCDFYVFSAHKVFGPTGIGALYGRMEHLEAMPPYQGGGDMIRSVTFEKTEYNDVPYKFEAGTPNIADVIGLGAAIDYVQGIGLDRIQNWEAELLAHATAKFEKLDGVRLIGTAQNRASLISFVMDGVHPHDIGTFLDYHGVAVRAGHHCAQPVMDRFGIDATARASFAFYNTKEEINTLISLIPKIRDLFGT